ncbi:hypothetical protein TWF281_006687 [Arthrobotrys megalospora]
MSKWNREDEIIEDKERIGNVHEGERLWHDVEGEDARRYHPKASTGVLTHDDYTVGWVCALPLEMAASVAMLDEIHTNHNLEKHPNDNNTYTLGVIGNHNIVIACLPLGVYGITSAAIVANQMSSTFTSICFWLMVGIGGGVPTAKIDIRLGDIVVSTGVIQYDYGKRVREGRFERTGTLNKPPQTFLTAVAKLQADHERAGSRIPAFLSEMLHKHPDMATKYTHRGQEQDILFEADYDHAEPEDTCGGCNETKLVPRTPRIENHPVVHYGLVASANQVMKHGNTRDQLGRELGVICFEMEAAGLMDNFPCLVIRGICDYSDSHKNKQWQEYSAAAAAAYTKELLLSIPATRAAKAIGVVAATPKVIKQRRLFMDALRFDQIDAHQTAIKSAHAKTCNWLVAKPEYRDWLDFNLISDHHGFLWIKGKPGTGKSTIMKFALKHVEKTMKETLIISFFFHARGDDLEKSTTGMYRSLLYQLLKKVPELQSVFDSLGPPPVSGGSYLWDIEMLKETFSRALEEFGQQRLICFIDALDECEEDQIRDMIAFFEDLGQPAISGGVQLHVCFSSRHYPHITIKQGRELVLEGQEGHDHDIANYLHSELKAGPSRQAQEIRTEILEKASGVFLWVVLVVHILNKEYDRGRIHALRKRLKEIPTRLNELFKDILTRDAQNMDDLLLCIQWILYAKRPLELVELYFAILAGQSPEDLGVWDPDEITKEDMGRFILSSSKGLAEVTKSAGQIVQFIHESVRDFLLKENGLSELWAEFGSLNSHERLKQCCYHYIKVDMSHELPLKEPLPVANTSQAIDIRLQASTKFPFLEYAVRNLLYHADLAGSYGSPQEAFIDSFPLETWVILRNLVEKYQIRRYTPKVSLLYILAQENLPHLSKIQLKRIPTMDIEGEQHCFPILAALAYGNSDVVEALLMPDADLQSESCISQCLYAEYRQEFLDQFIERGYQEVPKGQTWLSYAAEHGRWCIATLLLLTGKVNTNFFFSQTQHPGTPLTYAAAAGREDIVKLLLNKDADLYFRCQSRAPLASAAVNGHAAVMELLLDKAVKLARDERDFGRTQLPYAVNNGNIMVLELLLGKDVKLSPESDLDVWSVIWTAAERGHRAVVRLLLKYWAGPELEDGSRKLLYFGAGDRRETAVRIGRSAQLEPKYCSCGQTALFCAVLMGRQAAVKLLLERGVEPEPVDNAYRMPPLYAVGKRYRGIVKVLRNEGAKMKQLDHLGPVLPLYIDIIDGRHVAIVKMLLEEGAKAEYIDYTGRTPLSYGAGNGHEAIVKMLLEKGAKLESKSDDSGQEPLSYASAGGHQTVVRLLLEEGANIEAKDWFGRTALSWAVEMGHYAVVKMLLEKGARIEVRDRAGDTPLDYARKHLGHEDGEAIAQLLIDNCR